MGKTERECRRQEGEGSQTQTCSPEADECRLAEEIVGVDEGQVGRTEKSSVGRAVRSFAP